MYVLGAASGNILRGAKSTHDTPAVRFLPLCAPVPRWRTPCWHLGRPKARCPAEMGTDATWAGWRKYQIFVAVRQGGPRELVRARNRRAPRSKGETKLRLTEGWTSEGSAPVNTRTCVRIQLTSAWVQTPSATQCHIHAALSSSAAATGVRDRTGDAELHGRWQQTRSSRWNDTVCNHRRAVVRRDADGERPWRRCHRQLPVSPEPVAACQDGCQPVCQ